MDLALEAETAMRQSGIQIDSSTPIWNPDIAGVLRYLEQNPSSQCMLEAVAAFPLGMIAASRMEMGVSLSFLLNSPAVLLLSKRVPTCPASFSH